MANGMKKVELHVNELWTGICFVPGKQRKTATKFRSKKRIASAVAQALRKAA